MEKTTTVRVTHEIFAALVSFKGQLEKEQGKLVSLGEAIAEAIRRADGNNEINSRV